MPGASAPTPSMHASRHARWGAGPVALREFAERPDAQPSPSSELALGVLGLLG